VYLNNIRLERRWIKHSEIEKGGTLKFIMSDKAL
jgi:putative alpha-1,2-mannosidase